MMPYHTKFSVDRHFGYGKSDIKIRDIEENVYNLEVEFNKN